MWTLWRRLGIKLSSADGRTACLHAPDLVSTFNYHAARATRPSMAMMCVCVSVPARCRTPIIASSTSSSSFSPLTHPYPAARTAPHRHREPLLLVSHHGLNELAHTPRAVCDAKRGGVPSSSLILLARSSRCIPHRHPPISIPPTSAVQSNARRTLRAKAAAASQSDVAERRQGPRGRTPCLLHVVSVRSNPAAASAVAAAAAHGTTTTTTSRILFLVGDL